MNRKRFWRRILPQKKETQAGGPHWRRLLVWGGLIMWNGISFLLSLDLCSLRLAKSFIFWIAVPFFSSAIYVRSQHVQVVARPRLWVPAQDLVQDPPHFDAGALAAGHGAAAAGAKGGAAKENEMKLTFQGKPSDANRVFMRSKGANVAGLEIKKHNLPSIAPKNCFQTLLSFTWMALTPPMPPRRPPPPPRRPMRTAAVPLPAPLPWWRRRSRSRRRQACWWRTWACSSDGRSEKCAPGQKKNIFESFRNHPLTWVWENKSPAGILALSGSGCRPGIIQKRAPIIWPSNIDFP